MSFDPSHTDESRFKAWLRRRFPDRLIYIRTEGNSRTITLTTTRQVVFACMVTAVVGWTAYSTGMQYAHETIIASKRQQVAAVKDARDQVLAEVVSYRAKVDALTQELEGSQTDLAKLVERRAEIEEQIAVTDKKLLGGKNSKSAMVKLQATYDDLQNQLAKVNADAGNMQRKHARLSSELAEIGSRLQDLTKKNGVDKELLDLNQAIIERDFAQAERDELLAQNKLLGERLLQIQSAQKQIFDQVSDLASDGISKIERTLRKTGVDVEELLSKHEALSSGGPFIPAEFPDLGRDDLNRTIRDLSTQIARWDRLAAMMDVLPLGYPVTNPRITSGYGNRRDPFTGALALHSGIDFRGQKGEFAYSTAPGVVKYAKMRGNYGIVVDVDHGMGFVTRFAHLDKALVKVGDEVQVGTRVGLIGNTGRSTGRHLHYEIRYKNQPRNPKEMIRVKRYVQKID